MERMKTGFGWIEVGGMRHDHDIVIHVDRSVTKRKKKLSKGQKGEYGHTPLSGDEIGFIEREHPDVIFIGTGQFGDLPVTPEAAVLLERHHAVIGPTPNILALIEVEKRAYIAVLHTTC